MHYVKYTLRYSTVTKFERRRSSVKPFSRRGSGVRRKSSARVMQEEVKRALVIEEAAEQGMVSLLATFHVFATPAEALYSCWADGWAEVWP